MKRTFFLIICLVAFLILTSCNSTNITDTEKNNSKPDENINNSQGTSDGTVPVMVLFSSKDDIKEFILAATGTASQYTSFADKQTTTKLITYDTAKNVAANICECIFPNAKNNENVEGFGATYYVDRNELDVIYKINGIRYRFIYSFNTTKDYMREETPVLSNIPIGSSVLDLYQAESGGLFGSIIEGTTSIYIIVYTEDLNSVDFDCFDFSVISNDTVIK